jgi:hypothetical protein
MESKKDKRLRQISEREDQAQYECLLRETCLIDETGRKLVEAFEACGFQVELQLESVGRLRNNFIENSTHELAKFREGGRAFVHKISCSYHQSGRIQLFFAPTTKPVCPKKVFLAVNSDNAAGYLMVRLPNDKHLLFYRQLDRALQFGEHVCSLDDVRKHKPVPHKDDLVLPWLPGLVDVTFSRHVMPEVRAVPRKAWHAARLPRPPYVVSREILPTARINSAWTANAPFEKRYPICRLQVQEESCLKNVAVRADLKAEKKGESVYWRLNPLPKHISVVHDSEGMEHPIIL